VKAAYSRQLFLPFCRVGKLVFDVYTIGKCVLVTVNQSKHALYSDDLREDELEAAYKFVEEVYNFPAVWDVLSAAYKDTKNRQKLKVVAKGGISADIWFSISSPAMNIK